MLTLFIGGPRHGEVLSVEAGTNHAWVEISVAGKPVRQTYTPANYRAVNFHRVLVLPGSIDHSAEKRRGKK